MIEEGEVVFTVGVEFANGKTIDISKLASIGSFGQVTSGRLTANRDMSMTETEARALISLFDDDPIAPANPEEERVLKAAREVVEAAEGEDGR